MIEVRVRLLDRWRRVIRPSDRAHLNLMLKHHGIAIQSFGSIELIQMLLLQICSDVHLSAAIHSA